MTTERTTLGERVLIARRYRHWTQRELANRSGLDVSHISRIESGERNNPTLETVNRLVDALGADREWLLGGE